MCLVEVSRDRSQRRHLRPCRREVEGGFVAVAVEDQQEVERRERRRALRGSYLLYGVGRNQTPLLPAAQLQKHLAVFQFPHADLTGRKKEKKKKKDRVGLFSVE